MCVNEADHLMNNKNTYWRNRFAKSEQKRSNIQYYKKKFRWEFERNEKIKRNYPKTVSVEIHYCHFAEMMSSFIFLLKNFDLIEFFFFFFSRSRSSFERSRFARSLLMLFLSLTTTFNFMSECFKTLIMNIATMLDVGTKCFMEKATF